MCDYRSPYTIYPEEERRQRLIKDLHIDETCPITNLVESGMDKYNQLQRTPTITNLKAIKEGLLTSAKVINALREQIENSLDVIDGDDTKDVGSIMKDVTKLLQVSDQIPKAIDTINSLEEKVKKEQANESKIRGGGTKGMFED